MPKAINTIPCIDCITLPICRAQVMKNHEERKAILNQVVHKCSILYNYIFSIKPLDDDGRFGNMAMKRMSCTIRRNEALAVIRFMVRDDIKHCYDQYIPI